MFVCPWENEPALAPVMPPTTWRQADGTHAADGGIWCHHCGRCQRCGKAPDIELRIGGRAPGLYVDGRQVS